MRPAPQRASVVMEPIVKPVHAKAISNESAGLTSVMVLETTRHGAPVEVGFTATERCERRGLQT
jgi:hypothetical protein